MHRPREQSEDLLTEKRSPACEGEPRIRGSNACRFSQIFVHPPERQSRNCQSVNRLSSSKLLGQIRCSAPYAGQFPSDLRRANSVQKFVTNSSSSGGAASYTMICIIAKNHSPEFGLSDSNP